MTERTELEAVTHPSLHEETCSDALKLAREINDDVMAGTEEIARAIQAGFDYREARLRAALATVQRERDEARAAAYGLCRDSQSNGSIADAQKARAEKAEGLADKYKWQVVDTCKRAETSETLVTAVEAARGEDAREYFYTVERERKRSETAEARASALEQERDELARLVYVPGLWCCAKCNFTLIQSNLNALDGSVTARDTPGDKCPNCDVSLWRVTERQAGNDMSDRAVEQFELAKAAVALIERLLPGWSWETRKSAHSRIAYSRLWNPEIGPDSEQADTCRSGVPSLALVCAILRALIAKEVGNG